MRNNDDTYELMIYIEISRQYCVGVLATAIRGDHLHAATVGWSVKGESHGKRPVWLVIWHNEHNVDRIICIRERGSFWRGSRRTCVGGVACVVTVLTTK